MQTRIYFIIFLLLFSCKDSQSNHIESLREDSNLSPSTLQSNEIFSLTTSHPFYLHVVRRAANERIVYILRCTTAGSKCFQNISGQLKIYYQIPLDEQVTGVSTEGLYDSMSINHLATDSDVISVNATFMQPPTGFDPQSMFVRTVYLKLNQGKELILKPILDNQDQQIELAVFNKIFPYALWTDISYKDKYPLSDSVYDIHMKPSHQNLLVNATGNRQISSSYGQKSLRLRNVQNISFDSFDGIYKFPESSSALIEDAFNGSTLNKTLSIYTSPGTPWVLGKKDTGFHIERRLDGAMYIGLNGDIRRTSGCESYSASTYPFTNAVHIFIDLFRTSAGLEIFLCGNATGIIVTNNNITALSVPINLEINGFSHYLASTNKTYPKGGVDRIRLSERRYSLFMHKNYSNRILPIKSPVRLSDFDIGEIAWNNGTAFLGSIYVLNAQNQKRWLVQQGALNQNFNIQFDNPTITSYRTQTDAFELLGIPKAFKDLSLENGNPTVIASQLGMKLFIPSNYTYTKNKIPLNVVADTLSPNILERKSTIPNWMLSPGVEGQLGFTAEIPTMTELDYYHISAKSSNPSIVEIEKNGYFKIVSVGDARIELYNSKGQIIWSIYLTVPSGCPNAFYSNSINESDSISGIARNDACIYPVVTQATHATFRCEVFCANLNASTSLNTAEYLHADQGNTTSSLQACKNSNTSFDSAIREAVENSSPGSLSTGEQIRRVDKLENNGTRCTWVYQVLKVVHPYSPPQWFNVRFGENCFCLNNHN